MPKQRPDVFSGDLFPDAENPKVAHAPEVLQRDTQGRIIDRAGNFYDEMGNKIGEAPSERLQKALQLARKSSGNPNLKPSDPLVQFYVDRLRIEALEKEKQGEIKKGN
jgi:hypothetical protein